MPLAHPSRIYWLIWVGGVVVSTLAFYAEDLGFDFQILKSQRSALTAFSYAVFFCRLSRMTRKPSFQEPLLCNCLSTGGTKIQGYVNYGIGYLLRLGFHLFQTCLNPIQKCKTKAFGICGAGKFWEISDDVLNRREVVNYLENKLKHNIYNPIVAQRRFINIHQILHPFQILTILKFISRYLSDYG